MQHPADAILDEVKQSFDVEMVRFQAYIPGLLDGDPSTVAKARKSIEHMKRMQGIARVLIKEIERDTRIV